MARTAPLLRLVAETVEDVLWLVTPGFGQVLYVSAGYEKLWLQPESALSRAPLSWVDAVHADDRERVRAAVAAAGVEPWDLDYRIVRPDGSMRWIHHRGQGVSRERGRRALVAAVAADITGRKQTEERLRASEAQFRAVTQSANDAIILADAEGRISFWNAGARAIFGYKSQELLGKPLTILMPERYRRAHQEGLARIARTGEGRILGKAVELAGLRKDGREFPLELTLSVRCEGGVAQYSGIIRDISERKQAEALAHVTDRLQAENLYLQEEVREAAGFGDLVGQSPQLRNLVSQIDLVAPTDATVLVLGESGTGKELVAREIHKRSGRAAHPLIRVNCAAIPRELYESEFFGHVKGAFTGALRERAGRFEAADGGTLFLDEVGEIPLELQGKLLRVLQEGQYERVGDDHTRHVDVRIIAATNRDLRAELEGGRFRRDLYYRLHVFPIQIAPLRERREDIPLLAAHFLALSSRRLNLPVPRVTEAVITRLQLYDWPGNVRELHNVLERALITSRSGSLHVALPDAPAGTEPPTTPRRGRPDGPPRVLTESEMRNQERANLLEALLRTGWKVYGPGGAAELLGLKPTTLLARAKKLGLKKPPAST